MPSKREDVLQKLFASLQSGLPAIAVLRNAVLPTAIPEGGLIILRDGDLGEPDILLSPPRYIYKHRAEIEVFVQEDDAAKREANLDSLITQIAASLEKAGTLGGIIDILSPQSPELLTEAIEGAATIKAATIPVILEYVTTNPLI